MVILPWMISVLRTALSPFHPAAVEAAMHSGAIVDTALISQSNAILNRTVAIALRRKIRPV